MDARVSLELPFNMSKECTLMKVVKARENDVTLISEDGERWLFERNLGVRSGLESSRCTRTIWWSGCWVYIRLGNGEHIYEEGKGTGASPRIRICSHKIYKSKNIFIICMFKEHNLLILWRWRVENNLKMEDGWERSLHRRASMGKRSRSFYLDSDLNFLINYILECMCSTQFPFCTGYNWKGDSKLVTEPACKSDVYTVHCTSKGARWVWAWLGEAAYKQDQ